MGQTPKRKTITDEQHREFIEKTKARSAERGVVRFAGMYVAGALGISELDARRIVERVSMLMSEHGEITTDVYRRLNPPTHRSSRDGAEGKVRMR
jgi:hypothetical protein